MAKAKIEDNPVYTVTGPDPGSEAPEFGSEGWSNFLRGQLRKGEKDQDGNPRVSGLRRLTQEYFGTIVQSTASVVQAPSPDNKYTAVVSHTVVVAHGGDRNDLRMFTEVADVHLGNIDEMFAAHPTATASTRAESRALRKLLQLNGCTAEELISVEGGNFVPDDEVLASPQQIKTVTRYAKEAGVDVHKFINSGKSGRKYASPAEIPAEVIAGMIQRLNGYIQGLEEIPEELLK